jgi:hypothetical protein
MNESSRSWRVCVHVVFMWTHVQYETLRPRRLAVTNHRFVSCITQHVTCDLFSISFSFRLQLLNIVHVGVVHDLWSNPIGNNSSDSCPVNMVARTTHTRSALQIDSTGHSYQTHNLGRPRWHSLYVGLHRPAAGKKCFFHMPCSLNDRNNLILRLLQLLMVCYGVLHKDRSNKPLLADCTPHGTFCRVEWPVHNSVWIFRGPESRVLLAHELFEVEMGVITKSQVV